MIFLLALKSLVRVIPGETVRDYFVGFWHNLKRRAITSFSFILAVCMVTTGIGCVLVIGMRWKYGLLDPLKDYTTVSMFFVPVTNFFAYTTDVPLLHFAVRHWCHVDACMRGGWLTCCDGTVRPAGRSITCSPVPSMRRWQLLMRIQSSATSCCWLPQYVRLILPPTRCQCRGCALIAWWAR